MQSFGERCAVWYLAKYSMSVVLLTVAMFYFPSKNYDSKLNWWFFWIVSLISGAIVFLVAFLNGLMWVELLHFLF